MTPKQLKEAMRRQWEQPGVNNPLKPACWREAYGDRIIPNRMSQPDCDTLVLDQDEGVPLDPRKSR
jgi:hypothetical protein